MSSTSLYRKYRSQTFNELVGQEPVVRTLKNAIASDRLSHAYLFTGPRGVGKTSAARLLARAANCTATDREKPCNECPNCIAANRDIATDLIEIDAASNTGVDNIRELIERANFAPSVWSTKFYIVDEAHMLSTSAFNALLKTLEEPPAHVAFILATTEVHKVPATVASRCQRFDFRRVPLQAMVDRLRYICEQEGIEAEPAALELVARQATGSLRDALSLLDQLRVYAETTITLQSVQEMLGAGGSDEVAAFIDTLLDRDMVAGLRRINHALEEGLDLRQFNRQIVQHLRDLMLVKTGAASSEGALLDVTGEMKAKLQQQAERVALPEILRWTHIFSEADASLRSTVYGQLPLEMAVVAATLEPEATAPAPAPALRDHSTDIAQAGEQIGAFDPRQRPAPQRSHEARATRPSTVPPPIHSELGAMGGNGLDATPTITTTPPLNEGEPDVVEEVSPEAQAASAAPPEGSDELARLKELWPSLVDQINARSKPMGAAFRNLEAIRPVQLENGVCVISFRDHIQVQRISNSSKELPYRDIIEGALMRVLGYPCILEAVTFAQAESGDRGEDRASPQESRNGRNRANEKPSPYETQRGKAAMNIFGIDKFEEPQ